MQLSDDMPDFTNVQSGATSTAAPGFLERTFGVGSAFSDFLANNPLTNMLTQLRDVSVDEAKQKIRELYSTGLEFQDVYNQLAGYVGIAQTDPTLSAQYNALMSRGGMVRDTISAAVATVQNIVAYARDRLGVDFSDVGTPPPGLGFIQVIPAAIIGGVIAAIALAAAWIVDARSAITKLSRINDIVNTLPPEQRAAAVQQLSKQSGGLGDQFQKIVLWGAIAAGLIFFGPQLLKRFKA